MPALMRSELPELVRTGHHWIVLFKPPGKWPALATLVGLVLAAIWPWPWAVLLVIVLGSAALFRVHVWRAELIILTRKRIIRTQGVPETTTSEASLRIERVSGARLVQTVPGKLLGYGTIELEAPGDHPDVRRLKRIADPHGFYTQLRALIFSDKMPDDPDEVSGVYTTEPLPRVLPPGPRTGSPPGTPPPRPSSR